MTTRDDDRAAALEVVVTMRAAWQLLERHVPLVAPELRALIAEMLVALPRETDAGPAP